MKPLLTRFLVVIATFLLPQATAQTVQWAHSGTSPGYEDGNAIAIDDSGNVYVSGQIEYTTHFDGGQSLSSRGSHDIFAAKYAPDGTLKWARSAGGVSGDVGYGVAVDGMYNCYATGEIEKTVYFSSSVSLTSNGGNDIFVVKYGMNGQLIWAKSFGSTESDKGYSMIANQNGDVFVTGFYSAHIYFDNIHLTPSGLADVYTMKLNTNGDVQWAKKGAGPESDRGKGITFDSNGNIYVAGYFTDQATFGGTTITNNGSTGGFLVKYDPNGQLLWVKGNCCGTSEYDAITVDGNDNIYTSGYFEGTVTIGNTTLTSSGNSDILIVKYDTAGNVIWAKKAGGPYNDMANGITADTINHMLYITGQLDDHGYFDSHYAGAAGNRDVVIAAYDLNGNCQWVKTYGGVYRDIGFGIANDHNGNIFTTGIYTGNATFGNYNLAGNLLSDYYVKKVGPTAVSPPVIPSTNLSVTQSNCTDLYLSFTPGSGNRRVIIAYAGSPVNQLPLNGADYHADSIFGSGDDLGNGNYVIYNGSGNSVNVSGLMGGVTYYFAVYEFNGTGSSTVFLLNNPASSFQTTAFYNVNILPSANSLCAGDSVTLTASGGATYNWSPSSALSSTTDSLVSAFPVTTTTFTVTTNNNGCIVQNTVTLTVNQLPVVTFAINDSSCLNGNPYLLGGGSPLGGLYSGPGVVSGTFHPSLAGTGSVPINYTYTDVNGCINFATSSITVNPLPVVTLSLIDSICVNASPVVLTGGSPLGGVYSGNGVLSGSFDPHLAGVGSYPVNYIFTDSNGCINSATSSILVNQLPVVTLSLINSICENASPLTLTGGLPSGGVYSGQGVTSGSFDPSLSGSGSIPVEYTFTDGNGCSNSATSSIIVNHIPVVTLSLNNSICENASPISLTGGFPTGGIYSGTGVVSGLFNPSLAGTGSISIDYTFSDGNGCINSATSSITVEAAPNVTIGNDTTICVYNTITLNAGSGYSAYLWSDGSTSSSTIIDSTGTGIGTSGVTVVVENSSGCLNSDTIQITFSICTGIENANHDPAFQIYPNPFTHTFHLRLDKNADVYIFDVTGKLVEKILRMNGEAEFGENYSVGIYSIVILADDTKTVFRVVKNPGN